MITFDHDSVKQNDKKFSVCSGLPNYIYDAFEVFVITWDQKQKHPGRDGGEESQGKLLCFKKIEETESTPLSICPRAQC